jgi:hypothetical protein
MGVERWCMRINIVVHFDWGEVLFPPHKKNQKNPFQKIDSEENNSDFAKNNLNCNFIEIGSHNTL